MLVDDAAHHDALLAGYEAERLRQIAFAFEHHYLALLDALDPLRRRIRRDIADDHKIRRTAGGGGESDGRKNLRPGRSSPATCRSRRRCVEVVVNVCGRDGTGAPVPKSAFTRA